MAKKTAKTRVLIEVLSSDIIQYQHSKPFDFSILTTNKDSSNDLEINRISGYSKDNLEGRILNHNGSFILVVKEILRMDAKGEWKNPKTAKNIYFEAEVIHIDVKDLKIYSINELESLFVALLNSEMRTKVRYTVIDQLKAKYGFRLPDIHFEAATVEQIVQAKKETLAAILENSKKTITDFTNLKD